MTEALTSYLIQHKSISIPGLGTVYIERIPAQTDFINKQILPPSYHFRFDKYFDAPDKEFLRTWLSKRTLRIMKRSNGIMNGHMTCVTGCVRMR
ncbi:hypothetical protein [Paraflavitalea speifideaquila]|uniref:hypothetical protein n=1 Tax=Paraflavitalea speifideaquila TaxID=3076558 RepID=UPI0028E83D66|nr:hypothetical protein [Paraflavitalea speifideiaquila]